MKKNTVIYQCQACGFVSPKWLGRCPDCGQWNTLVEERDMRNTQRMSVHKGWGTEISQPRTLREISCIKEKRIATGINELDRVLGGGIVPGSLILIGGDPGIGKSTLLLQAMNGIASSGKVLYISGEESLEQVKMRAERLNINSENILLQSETNLENILSSARKLSPLVMVVDSIQTMYSEELPSAPGSVGQVRECAQKLMFFSKSSGTSIFIIGHVTKEGSIAGPRVLEHIVDTVIYFEGEKGHSYRILRAVKNRFGSSNEIGVFEMSDDGLREIENPSELFLSERPEGATGTVVTASMEGTRPILLEFQALVSPATFGVPRRTSIGVDPNRVSLLIAVLEKKAGIHLIGMDVFVNVVGGLKVVEPAADLAIIASLSSSVKDKPIDPHTIIFGEVGLSGEIRAVSHADLRLREAQKIAFKKAIIPKVNAERLKANISMDIRGVKEINEAMEYLFR
ncbi:MAG: DNA repair protein RadA [Thermodesulfovibrionales bacterium]|nr:DNA repair protein RadA [Thermodesulfovibrionales bacterium]